MRLVDAVGLGLIVGATVLGALFAVAADRWGTSAYVEPTSAPSAAAQPQPSSTPAVAAPVPPTAGLSAPAPQSPAATPAATAAEGALQLGAQLFSQNCDSCHPRGQRGIGPDLRGPEFAARYQTDAALRQIIRAGAGGMPAYPESRLSDNQLDALLAFLRSL